ncbi:MAG TPA: SEC-C metal-binding domain-containing protein [Phycisphaerae bacterium]|nr:SEC-C metal-binding domain-containing protein [Phycisphaerae bacterium]
MSKKTLPELNVPEILKDHDRRQAREFLRRNKVGRNSKCPCGSGRKFKQCCMREVSE